MSFLKKIFGTSDNNSKKVVLVVYQVIRGQIFFLFLIIKKHQYGLPTVIIDIGDKQKKIDVISEKLQKVFKTDESVNVTLSGSEVFQSLEDQMEYTYFQVHYTANAKINNSLRLDNYVWLSLDDIKHKIDHDDSLVIVKKTYDQVKSNQI